MNVPNRRGVDVSYYLHFIRSSLDLLTVFKKLTKKYKDNPSVMHSTVGDMGLAIVPC